MNEPKTWSLAELETDVAQARELFRQARLDEPLGLYSQFFDAFVPVFAELIDRLPELLRASLDPSEVADLVATGDARTAFRYLPGATDLGGRPQDTGRDDPRAERGGVFNPSNLETAQAEGLSIVWSHRLDDLSEFVEAAK